MIHDPLLLDDVRRSIRTQQLSSRTEQSYVDWIYRFFAYNAKRDPFEMGAQEVVKFLSYLGCDCQKSASTQNQALCALLFLYKEVLKRPLPPLDFVRVKKEKQTPVVFTRNEVSALLARMSGVTHLLASLLYGSGLRVMEAMQLRVKDLDLQNNQLRVWQPEEGNYRTTLFPVSLKLALSEQMYQVSQLHLQDLAEGHGEIILPETIKEAYPEKALESGWQFLFPSARRATVSGTDRQVRNHLHESVLQKAVKEAMHAAGLNPAASCHSLRHSFAVHLLENGCKIKTLKELLGHRDIRSTMIYIQIVDEKRSQLKSPLDVL